MRSQSLERCSYLLRQACLNKRLSADFDIDLFEISGEVLFPLKKENAVSEKYVFYLTYKRWYVCIETFLFETEEFWKNKVEFAIGTFKLNLAEVRERFNAED